jgi:peptidoglycan-associated lipoprotein
MSSREQIARVPISSEDMGPGTLRLPATKRLAVVGGVLVLLVASQVAHAQATSSPPVRPTPTFPRYLPSPLPTFEMNVGDRIFFSPGSDEIDAAAMWTLERQAAWMKQWPMSTYLLEGYSSPSESDPVDLSARRAARMKSVLVQLGVSSDRLATVSYGASRPTNTAAGEPASPDRRVVAVPQGCDGGSNRGKPSWC